MATERVGIEAPWRWLQQAVTLLRRHPRVLFLGALQLVMVALLPTALQLILLSLMPSQAGLIQGLGFALSLLLYPVAVGGFYRLLHAADGNRDPGQSTVLEAFSDSALTRRMVLLNLLFVSLSLLVISLLALALDGDALAQYVRAMSTLQEGATKLPPLPDGLLPMLLALIPIGVALVCAQGLSSAECAIRERPPLAAMPAGFRAVWRNFVTLLLFFVPASVLSFLLFMLVALAGALVGAMLAAVLGKWVGGLVLLATGVLAAITMYALLFAFFYYAWRELFEQAPAPPAAAHSIAA